MGHIEIREAISDAMQLVEAYHHLDKKDAVVSRIRNLLKAGMVERAISLVSFGNETSNESKDPVLSLEKDEKVYICLQTMAWIFECVDASTHQMRLMEAMHSLSKVLEGMDPQLKCFGLDLQDVQKIYALAKEYDIVLTPVRYRSAPYKKDILKKHIEFLFSDKGKGTTNGLSEGTLEKQRLSATR